MSKKTADQIDKAIRDIKEISKILAPALMPECKAPKRKCEKRIGTRCSDASCQCHKKTNLIMLPMAEKGCSC